MAHSNKTAFLFSDSNRLSPRIHDNAIDPAIFDAIWRDKRACVLAGAIDGLFDFATFRGDSIRDGVSAFGQSVSLLIYHWLKFSFNFWADDTADASPQSSAQIQPYAHRRSPCGYSNEIQTRWHIWADAHG